MHRFVFFSALVITTACSSPSTQCFNSPPLDVRVLDGVSGTPLCDAQVTVNGATVTSVGDATNCSYGWPASISPRANDHYTVDVAHAGYQPMHKEGTLPGQADCITPTTRYDLRLSK